MAARITDDEWGEEYAQPPGWMGKVEVYADRVAARPADQVLTKCAASPALQGGEG